MDLKLTGHLVSGQLVRANLALARTFTERLKGMGLYLGQELILLALQEENGMTQSQLAARHCVDLSTITKVIAWSGQNWLCVGLISMMHASRVCT